METKQDSSAPGEVMEMRVWAELIEQSGGALHIFLPLLDRGLDGVAHRLTDGAYLPMQVKGQAARQLRQDASARRLVLLAAGEPRSPRATVKTHVINIYGKTGVKTRAGATLYALEEGLLEPSGL